MMGLVRGMITLSLLLLFVTFVVWAWSGRRKDLFDRMAQIPLDDQQ